MKKIGIGYEDYRQFVEQDLYYVDKTLLVSDVLEQGGAVTLFTRPRRFGKTLGLSMLRTFFELEYDREGCVIDKRPFFEGRKVMSCGDAVLSHMGQYPVIMLSLKGAKQPTFRSAFMAIHRAISSEYDRHSYLQHSQTLDENSRQLAADFLMGEINWLKKLDECRDERDLTLAFETETAKYAEALKTLSFLLQKHHGKKTMILLDEYDVPLENAWKAGFYDEMIGFIRSLFESALKTNDSLERAVITGCLRISRESIFTGLNHLKIISVRSNLFTEGFGFTPQETERMLSDYGLDDKVNEVREWYDGYLFGTSEIYNPWSVISYVDAHLPSHDAFPEPYWSNTSSNAIIKDLVDRADEKAKEELDLLIGGGTIEKRIHEDITYSDIYTSEDNLWSFLFFTGYMKKVSERQVGEDIYVSMRIPNLEILSIYRNQIRIWFDNRVKQADRSVLYRAVRDQDVSAISSFLTELLQESISVFDSEESFYHGFFLSLLYGMPHYSVRSNREEGDGRPDIVLYPKLPQDPAYIFECKVRKKYNEMQDGMEEAFRQIEDKRYAEGILEEGYAGAAAFGICFCKKSCIVGMCMCSADQHHHYSP